jgi:DNA-directed RNA polymerase delta subunit
MAKSIKKYKKEELELLSNKDIAELLITENGPSTTADLYKEIIDLLELPSSTFDKHIGDFFQALNNDKRFKLLQDGTWDLTIKHVSEKIEIEDEDEEEGEEKEEEEIEEEEDDEDNYDSTDDDDDDGDDDLMDLVVLDEDEMELEQ